ncbi:MAG: HEAT repeat domain-containing protein [Polyangiaceae bacterium]
MRFSSLTAVLALSAGALVAIGCGGSLSRAEYISMLQSPDAGERRDAADELMDDGGPPPEAVPALIAALEREQDAKTYSVMLLALGKSGAPEALPYLQANRNNQSKVVRERAEKALELWARKNPGGVPTRAPGMGPGMGPPPPGMGPPPPGMGPPPPEMGPPPSGGENGPVQVPPPPPPPPPPPADDGQSI